MTNEQAEYQKHIRTDFRGSIANLILLSIVQIIILPVLFVININPNRTHWSYVAIYLAYYSINVILIWINRKNLADFNITRLFIILFLFFGTLFRIDHVDNYITLFFDMATYPVAIILMIKLWKSNIFVRMLNRNELLWMTSAVLIGFVMFFFANAFDLHKINLLGDINYASLLSVFGARIFIEIGKTGIIEEPIYRGFLWGTLRNLGLREHQAWLFQAFFFWISHLNMAWYAPYTFWIALPISSLLLGLLSWKSKSIVPPLIAHVIYNALNSISNVLLQ